MDFIERRSECPENTCERKQIGMPVNEDQGFAGSTFYTFYQCQKCGSLATKYEDKSPAGGGKFERKITFY